MKSQFVDLHAKITVWNEEASDFVVSKQMCQNIFKSDEYEKDFRCFKVDI